MSTLSKTIEYKNYTIEIHQDLEPESPREWDNMGKMICFHKRHCLGDDHNLTLKEAKRLEKSKDIIALPLYLYDHSGLTIRTTPFSCPWDSGQVGFIYITKEDIKKEYRWKRLTKDRIKEIKERVLKVEVEVYDKYLTGEVYGYIIRNHVGTNVDSCLGFFGDPAINGGLVDQAKEWVDWEIKEIERASKEKFPLESKEATMKILQESEKRRRDDKFKTTGEL